jgi:hypothetical protein
MRAYVAHESSNVNFEMIELCYQAEATENRFRQYSADKIEKIGIQRDG